MKSVLLQGVVIVRGNALAEVTAIGQETQLAHIASTASTVQAESELVKSVDKISNFIMKVTLLTLGFVVVANILIEGRQADVTGLLIFAIALAVSAIPEALPLVLTFSLSRGALEFAKRDVIVKRLSAVQDLGSVNLLCTDKTGTITENHLVSAMFIRWRNRLTIRWSWRAWLPSICMSGYRNLSTMQAMRHSHMSNGRLWSATVSCRRRLSIRRCAATVRFVKQADGITLHIRRGSPEYFFGEGLISRDAVADWLAGGGRKRPPGARRELR